MANLSTGDQVTERLYYQDAYADHFIATVVEAWTDDDGRTRVVLDRSLFYPTSGGQLHDRGTLGSDAVVDVLDEGERVVHVVEALAPPPPGTVLEGVIDATRRAHHRQQHTGQHVLSRIVEDRLGLPTVSSRLGETGNTLDLSVDDLDWSVLEEIEDAANAAIWAGRRVEARLVPPDQLEALGLRKVPDRDGPLRIIEVAGVDRTACGGTHVANTAEIGQVSILRKERIRGGLRLHFLCGQRAQEFRRHRDTLVRRLSHQLTTGDDQLEALVAGLREELKAARREVKILTRQLLEARAAGWAQAAEEIPLAGTRARLVVQSVDAELAGPLGDLAGRLAREAGDLLLAIFVTGPGKTQLLLVTGPEVPLDCRDLLRRVLTPLSGSGGGRPDHARGSFPGVDVRAATELLRDELAERA